jgi:hypothetical protein
VREWLPTEDFVEIGQRTGFEIVIAGENMQGQAQPGRYVRYLAELLGRCVIGIVARQNGKVDGIGKMPVGIIDQPGKNIETFSVIGRNVSTILRQPSVEFKLGCLAFSAVD